MTATELKEKVLTKINNILDLVNDPDGGKIDAYARLLATLGVLETVKHSGESKAVKERASIDYSKTDYSDMPRDLIDLAENWNAALVDGRTNITPRNLVRFGEDYYNTKAKLIYG